MSDSTPPIIPGIDEIVEYLSDEIKAHDEIDDDDATTLEYG